MELVTNWSQRIKEVTKWSQTGHRLVTDWSQTGHRLVTDWSQTGHRLVTAVKRGYKRGYKVVTYV